MNEGTQNPPKDGHPGGNGGGSPPGGGANGGTGEPTQTPPSRAREGSFFRERPGLPKDLCAYVKKRDRDTDDQHDLTLAYAMALISGWAYADHDTILRQLRYNDVDADITYIQTENDAMLLVAKAYFLRWRSGRLGGGILRWVRSDLYGAKRDGWRLDAVVSLRHHQRIGLLGVGHAVRTAEVEPRLSAIRIFLGNLFQVLDLSEG